MILLSPEDDSVPHLHKECGFHSIFYEVRLKKKGKESVPKSPVVGWEDGTGWWSDDASGTGGEREGGREGGGCLPHPGLRAQHPNRWGCVWRGSKTPTTTQPTTTRPAFNKYFQPNSASLHPGTAEEDVRWREGGRRRAGEGSKLSGKPGTEGTQLIN